MARQTVKVKVFESQDISSLASFERKINANIGYFVQFNYTGVAGPALVKFYASTDGVNWVLSEVSNPTTGAVEDGISLGAGSGSVALQSDAWRADFVKIEVSGATAGTLDAFMDYQENY